MKKHNIWVDPLFILSAHFIHYTTGFERKAERFCFIFALYKAELLIGNINFDLKINGVGKEENVVEEKFLENRKINKFEVNLFDVFLWL